MLIKNVSREDIENALERVNSLFGDNIRFKRLERDRNSDRYDRFNVTLTVKDSRGPGTRRGHSGRRIAAACWHVYGEFMDSLPRYARIYAPTVIYKNGKRNLVNRFRSPGDEWEDWNIGSEWQPFYYSQACDCDGG